MRIVVDFDSCKCHALCTAAAPEIFAITDDGFLDIKIEEPGEDLRPKVEAAVRDCPTQSITLEA
jgi:ferredoxin